MWKEMEVDGGSGGGGDLKQLHVGTPSSATIDLGEPFEYLFVSTSYQSYLCNCEWDSSTPSSYVRYYGGNDPATIQLPATGSSPAGLSSVSPSNGTFNLNYYSYMKNVEVFYK